MDHQNEQNLISVIIGKTQGNPLYFTEILIDQGYFFNLVPLKKIKKAIKKSKILVIYGPITISRKIEKKITKFVENGGSLIIFGEVKGLEDILGCNYIPLGMHPYPIGGTLHNSIGEGYLQFDENNNTDNPMKQSINNIINRELSTDYFPLHGFGCLPVELEDAIVIATYIPNSKPDRKYPAITVKKCGKGISISFNPDVAKTVRHIQEGIYIDKDGIPPADGRAPIDDGILKCEDGLVLDWLKDRRTISKHKIDAFLVPVADIWKTLVAKMIDFAADHANAEIERIMHWPNGADFVMMISHDTDGNNEKLARGFLNEINSLDIKTTWCLIPPGYSSKLCEEIESFGHELAFHFDTQSYQIPNMFSFEVLKEQIEETLENTTLKQFYSNKNHYTRWEGRIEFFIWLEELGFKVDQSKGPSKCGTLGFPFGTAHPWLPMDKEGRIIECLEIGFQSQDLGLQGPKDTGKDIVDSVKKIRGVCHFIFHPAHFSNLDVRQELRNLVHYAKEQGAQFMRSIDIGEWYFARRKYIQTNKNCAIDQVTLNKMILEKRNCVKNCWEKII
ncbi:MAG: hypothetical protein GF364_02085 [Candidatus Lokiarchaeota archaeon]|nr:hypothetical protein [Candidatus Lokiarchaeota archaeon]